jgi:DNA-directed RNA polymerase subunit H (RpoH/RPB5)
MISNISNSRKTIIELLKVRGYDVSSLDNFSINEIKVMLNSKEIDFELKKGDNEVFVKYLISSKMRNTSLKNNITDFIDSLDDSKDLSNIDLVIILKDKPNESLYKVVDDIYNEKQLYVNLFWIKNLQINILDHEYVPKHELITEGDFKQLKTQYNLNSRYQLPIIYRHDPVSKCLGIRPGEVVKITRPSVTAGEYTCYRCCK